jgi:methionine-rich copper-binding protein CopC
MHDKVRSEIESITGYWESVMIKRGFAAMAVVGMILAGPAFGHAKLRSTLPAADAQLAAAPKSLTLTFNESVRLAVLSVAAGDREIPVAVDRSAPAAPQVTIALPALMPGYYQVRWSVLAADDGHASQGTFSFTILTPGTAPATPATPAASH